MATWSFLHDRRFSPCAARDRSPEPWTSSPALKPPSMDGFEDRLAKMRESPQNVVAASEWLGTDVDASG